MIIFAKKDSIMKTAKTVDEQINILQSRGIIISNSDKAKEILQDIGYYRLGFYFFPFEESHPKIELIRLLLVLHLKMPLLYIILTMI